VERWRGARGGGRGAGARLRLCSALCALHEVCTHRSRAKGASHPPLRLLRPLDCGRHHSATIRDGHEHLRAGYSPATPPSAPTRLAGRHHLAIISDGHEFFGVGRAAISYRNPSRAVSRGSCCPGETVRACHDAALISDGHEHLSAGCAAPDDRAPRAVSSRCS